MVLRPPRRWIYVISPLLTLLMGYYLFYGPTSRRSGDNILSNLPPQQAQSRPSDCPRLPGLEDIQVVLKTGATESLDKVTAHFNTTLRCIPHYVVFSDLEEDVSGIHFHDVLRGVSEDVRNYNQDFEIYDVIREYGREEAFKLLHGSDPTEDDPNGALGQQTNPGWRLDKWKFLQMIHESLAIRDDAKWYIFMETDTYIVWSNLLTWLEKFDHTKPYYLGGQMQIADIVFAYGGSGIILSQVGMRQVADHHAAHLMEWDEFTAQQWAGDCVLGKVAQDAGVTLRWAWPMLQFFTPWDVNYQVPLYGGKSPWCFPSVSFHHMKPDDIQKMVAFEEQWSQKHNETTIMLYSDVFRNLIQPNINTVHENWDNLAGDDSGKVKNLAECKARCLDDTECLQYAYESKKCRTSKVVQLGGSKSGVTSGWHPERVNAVLGELGSCEDVDWIAP
ncbi:hypothetical protein FE257_000246 [Aspergillus nanangensis]|uniref:N-acetylgalactosaminide beta-1,3-galactosyltransferase n=1 Tax=Aspergillus nanangensis TaxID=2582783 RepID=A0AAD4CZF3_ASPNN|nr:hypothetical protein FE257_000246 [Aspergillus nanangensis]